MGSKKVLSFWEKRRFSGLAGRQEFERNKPAEMLGRGNSVFSAVERQVRILRKNVCALGRRGSHTSPKYGSGRETETQGQISELKLNERRRP